MKKLSTLLILSGLSSVVLLAGACSKRSNHATKVTVAGNAETRVEPDTAVLVISVVTQSGQAVTAQQQNARKSEAVSQAVKANAANVEIKTSDYTLQPEYDYRDNKLPKIIGYNARNSVIVTLTELNKVGAVIDAASQAGANSIDGISFVLRQTSPARGQALADATQQAMNKARSIAQALGGHVSRVVEENESSTVGGEAFETINALDAQMTRGRTAITPVTPGHLNIKSNVQLVVEIES